MAKKRKYHTYCCVPQCTSKELDENLSFHRFPKNDKLRTMKWLLNLRIGRTPSKNMTVCSKHFTKFDFFAPVSGEQIKRRRLKSIAIPSRNLPVCPFEKTENEEEESDDTEDRFQETKNSGRYEEKSTDEDSCT